MTPAPSPPVERTAGSLDEALANGRRLLGAHPDLALAQAQAILARDPRETRALRLAAAAHRARGEAAFAERAELVAIEHSGRIPALAAARTAMRAGDFGEASRLAAEHLRRERDDLAAMTLSAETAVALGVPDKAEPLLREILRRVPSFGHARHLLANALMLMDRPAEAIALLDEMLAREPDDAVLLNMLARAQADIGRFDRAAAIRERLVALEGNAPESWIALGDSRRFAGRKADAAQAYRSAIAADPTHGAGWWSLADLDPRGLGEDDVARIERALDARRAQPEHASNLHVALGLVHAAHGRHAEAFAQFAAGNSARRGLQPYDPTELSDKVDAILRHFPAASIPARAAGASGPVPVFLLGMPRSGSTLLERALGEHSAIEALGELPIVPHLVERLKRDAPDEPVEARLAALGEAELAALRAQYFERVKQFRQTDRPFFIDKLHMNWKHLPLILRLLPEAVAIDLRRDALDCCWSNYRTLFSHGHPAANDLGDIGLFYRDYVRCLDALRERAPNRILFAHYEDLVDDLEGVTTPMLEALGIAFEPGMAEFHRSRAPVATASSEQVRRPLNRDGIGTWRAYEAWLGPLKAALGISGGV